MELEFVISDKNYPLGKSFTQVEQWLGNFLRFRYFKNI